MRTYLSYFRSTLNTEFIQPNKDHRNKLKLPPREYPKITKFVNKMLGTEFQVSYITVVNFIFFVTLIL